MQRACSTPEHDKNPTVHTTVGKTAFDIKLQ